MSKFPRNPEAMAYHLKKAKERVDYCIPILMVVNARSQLRAWHGSYWRAGWRMILMDCLYMGTHRAWCIIRIKICDWMGWTKLVPFMPNMPKGQEMFTRHGAHCDKMNCQDMHCIERSVPKWYRWLTHWENEE